MMTGRRRGRPWRLAVVTAVAAVAAVSPLTWAGEGSDPLHPASSLGNATARLG
jgi:hypothetical protein